MPPECLKMQRLTSFCAAAARVLFHLNADAPCFARKLLCAARYALTSAADVRFDTAALRGAGTASTPAKSARRTERESAK